MTPTPGCLTKSVNNLYLAVQDMCGRTLRLPIDDGSESKKSNLGRISTVQKLWLEKGVGQYSQMHEHLIILLKILKYRAS
jgi:hypothetical protein